MEDNVTPPQNTIPIRRPGAEQTAPVSQPVPQQYPTEVISLPSKGWFYPEDNVLSTGQVEMKMMTAKEEDILSNQNYIKKGIVFDKILESLIIDKSIDLNTLMVMDQNALLIAARRLAYGDSYRVNVTCPRCDEVNDLTIDLSTLEEKEIDVSTFPKAVDELSFTLPKSKIDITFKILSQSDMSKMEAELRHNRKSNKNESSNVTTQLRYLLTSVGGNRDKIYIKNFINNNMLAMDARAFRDYLSESLPGIDNKFDFTCSTCDHSERMDVPMTVQFFWPESGR